MLIYILGTVLFVAVITKFFPFPSQEYQFNNAKKSAIYSLLIIAIEIMISIAFIRIVDKFLRSVPEYGLLCLQSFIYFLLTAIVILVVVYRKEGLQSIGVTRSNSLKSCILGIFLGVIFFIFYKASSKTNETLNLLTITSVVSLIKFLIVGFAEEIIYRGYVQTRLVSWLGTTKGCLITAVIFSFYHLPHNMVFRGMDLQTAFMSCINLIPLSLMFGYIMLKTKNITTVAMLHTIINWTIN